VQVLECVGERFEVAGLQKGPQAGFDPRRLAQRGPCTAAGTQ